MLGTTEWVADKLVSTDEVSEVFGNSSGSVQAYKAALFFSISKHSKMTDSYDAIAYLLDRANIHDTVTKMGACVDRSSWAPPIKPWR